MCQGMKSAGYEYKIIMNPLSKNQTPIHCITGDMISPSQGSSLFQDSSLNKTPGENCYIQGYEGPNEISQDVAERERNLISVIKVSDPKAETVTRGSPYNFTMMNIPEIGHLGKTLISPNW